MRVLKIFFTAILLIAIAGFIGFFSSREILLSTALRQIKNDIKFLSHSSSAGDFFKECLEFSNSFDDAGSIVRHQLRFTSDSSYVLESVCRASESLRTILKSKSLPPLVRRVEGQSGIVQGESGYGVEVSIFGRSGVVYDYEGIIFTETSNLDELGVILDDGPPTICSGYGYVCCDENFQTGQDFKKDKALDCPRSCYASCVEKPVVLTFNSEPAADPENRTVYLNSGDFIEFVYTISDVKGDVFVNENVFVEDEEVTWSDKLLEYLDKYSKTENQQDIVEEIIISFGDGTSEKLLDLHGRTNHTYTCERRSICVYDVTLQATTKLGVESSLDGISKLKVQVRN